jgi:putative endonuclease
MLNRRQKLGRAGEAMARRHLEKQGYRIIETNYRSRLGEIDLIAVHDDTLVFIEVKTRNSARYGSPRQAITAGKQKKISTVALGYLKSTRQTGEKARFDVVLIDTSGARPDIETIQNAFPLAYER